MIAVPYVWRCPSCGHFQAKTAILPGLDTQTKCAKCNAENVIQVVESASTITRTLIRIEVGVRARASA